MPELSWEALEDAGVVPHALEGSSTGVFAGASAGTQRRPIANRVSGRLGTRGPSLVVDAGQASDLVAVQLACESLRRGESSLALAGGVHPAEGGGVVVLKPLADALADGDAIYCTIRGGAVNHDGSSDGVAVMSEVAQAEVVRLACRRARVARHDVQDVEFHGIAGLVEAALAIHHDIESKLEAA